MISGSGFAFYLVEKSLKSDSKKSSSLVRVTVIYDCSGIKQNTTAVSTINPATGKIVFSVPMQGFEFEKALMQKHFNGEDFLDTKEFPKAKLTGKITNIAKTVEVTLQAEYAAQ